MQTACVTHAQVTEGLLISVVLDKIPKSKNKEQGCIS